MFRHRATTVFGLFANPGGIRVVQVHGVAGFLDGGFLCRKLSAFLMTGLPTLSAARSSSRSSEPGSDALGELKTSPPHRADHRDHPDQRSVSVVGAVIRCRRDCGFDQPQKLSFSGILIALRIPATNRLTDSPKTISWNRRPNSSAQDGFWEIMMLFRYARV